MLQTQEKITSLKKYFPKGFLADYFDYAEPLTDAPPEFHAPVALNILSAVLGRNIWLQIGDKRLYPNFWSAIIAPSGVQRKSTALNIGSNLLRGFDHTIFSSTDFSMASFLSKLSDNPKGILVYSELVNLLELCERKYNLGLKTTLTDFFDCPDYYCKSLKTENIEIRDIFINIIGAAVIEWFTERITKKDIASGFLARFMYFQSAGKVKCLPIVPEIDKALREKLINEMIKISKITGKMNLSKEAEEVYAAWYKECDENLKTEIEADLMGTFTSRSSDYCFKMAMLYAVSVDHCTTISRDAMQSAVMFINNILASLRNFIYEKFDQTEHEKNKRRIFNAAHRFYKRHKFAITYSELIRFSHVSPINEFKSCLEALTKGDLIEHTEKDVKTYECDPSSRYMKGLGNAN